ncbi:MAG TPA: SAM-dependent methyltransferase, partial [Prolixibacteraceae bacterium]|nr:SAM-dependent methyltransferase [Prolixibacteraceae bacterium]
MSTAVSYQTIEAKLQTLHETTSAQEFGYDLLRIFNAMSETKINRIKEGKDNLLKTENAFLANKTLAYCWCKTIQLATELENLKHNAKVTKAAPRLLVVSDGVNVLAYDPKEKESYDNEIAKIRFDYQFFMPLAGVERYQAVGEEEADVKAAYKMARIFDEIRRYNEIDYKNKQDIHALNVFMSRLLFCFFAEDTGIFQDKIFTNAIKSYTLEDGSDVGNFLDEAFDIMSTNSASIRAQKSQAIRQFPYVNGGLFSVHYSVPTLGWKARRLLLECGILNWDKINPDIFGSMIQAVISPELRSSLGLHYTSVSNIMKVIQPLFLDELYAEFASARNNEKQLRKLLIRISKIKFFDPACGSGNFLIIIYKELRKLEIQIWQQLEKLSGERIIPFSNIQLTQFYGIELDEYAQETAILSLWLAEHQMNKEFEDRFHIHVDALPLRSSGNIVKGNACRLNWNTVCPHKPDEEVYIMGNPPYLGSKLQSSEQKEDMSIALSELSENKTIDYIAAWFWKASKFISKNDIKCAFVTTNSICQGEQVSMLWPYIYELNLTILFAYTSFKWTNNAKYNAGVTVAIIGLANKFNGKRKLFNNDTFSFVENINPYLTGGSNIIVYRENTTPKGLPKLCFGIMPYDNGNLLLSKSEKDNFVQQYPSDADLLKQIMGSQEFIRGEERFCFWIDDNDLERALKNPFIANRIALTKQVRLNSPDVAGRKLAERPYQFREFIELSNDSIIVPAVSSESREYIPIGFLDADTIISNSAFAIYDAQLWLFGILTSKMHMAWVKSVGGKLETRYRYSATLCYNTFPFPKISEAKR